MSEAQTVRAHVGDGIYIEFTSQEDALLFVANAGEFHQFREVAQRMGAPASTIRYKNYRTVENRLKCIEMMERTSLTNGLTLYQAVQQKIVKMRGGLI